MPKYEQILFNNMSKAGYTGSLKEYEAVGGYTAFKKVLKEYSSSDVIDIVKKSGLRGRGGAGFPAGLKWSFIPKDHVGPRYLCCNADESEPGTYKDRQLMEFDPHQMLEGMAICCYAIGAQTAYIYIRGEFDLGAEILENAIQEAYKAKLVGKDLFGSGFNLDIYVHRGAGAYICGEETALLESLEGKRGKPRIKPPFPAINGLYQEPTVINNVETLANVPYIINKGPEWFRTIGTEKSPGTKVFSVSGHVKKPGNYELPLGIPLREIIYDVAGGILGDKQLKAVIPGGASAPMMPPDQLDTPMDFDSVAAVGSMLGSAAITVMDEDTCIVWAAMNLMEFFYHESCGQCTPCREGSGWILQILRRIEGGEGRHSDLDQLLELCTRIGGRTVCAFGDAEIGPILSTIKHFRSEYERHIEEKGCPFHPNATLSMAH